ncbi:MAG: hypothetical protein ACEQSX_01530 [Baekduiaceae bacterium]
MGTVTTAVLRLNVEGGSTVTTEVRKATADLKAAQKDIEKASVDAVTRIEAAQKAASERARGRRRRDAVETVRETVQVAQQQGATYRQGAAVAERAEQLVTRAKLRELALQGDAQKAFVALYADAHKRATAAFEAEVGKRGQLSQREQHQVETVALAMVHGHERGERERTAATQRESARRVRQTRDSAALIAQIWRDASGAAGTVAGGVQQYAGQAHGVIQDATQRRNGIQATVADALSQVGINDAASINRYTDQVIGTGASAGVNMRPEAIAEAIQIAQERTNLIGRMGGLSGAARDAVFTDAVGTAVRGRNLGLDPNEFTELHGMLANRGLTDADRAGLETWSVGAQDRGALNISTLLRQSKSAIVQRMAAASNALPATASREQRSAAEASAYRQAVAEVEVLKDAGVNAGVGSGAMATYERVLSNTGTQAKMRTNLSHIADPALRRRVTETLFDRNGLRAGLTNPLMFTGALLSAGMTDPTMTANIFAGTGAGNAQSLAANVRRMQTAMQGRDADNRSGVDRVRAYLAPGVAITPEQERERAAMRASLGVNVQEGETARGMASTLGHGAQAGVSNAAARAVRVNPLGMAALGGAVTTVGGLAAKSPVTLGIMASVLGAFGNLKAVATGQTMDGRQLSMRERLTRGAGYVAGAAIAGTGSMLAAPAVATGMLMPGLMDAGRVGTNQFRGSGMREALGQAINGIFASPLRIASESIQQLAGAINRTPAASGDDVHGQTNNAGNGGR